MAAMDMLESSLLLLFFGIGQEEAKRQQRTDRDIFMVHDICPGQWKVIHDRLSLGDVPGVQQEDGSATVAPRIPFANLSIQIELHGLADLRRQYAHHLLARDTGPHR